MMFGLFAEGSGRNPVDSPETIFEIIAAVKAAVCGNFSDRVIRSQKHLAGLANSDEIDVFLKGDTCDTLEFPGEIGGSEINAFCDFLQGQRQGEVLRNVTECRFNICADRSVFLQLFVNEDAVTPDGQQKCHHLKLQKFIGKFVWNIILPQHCVQQCLHGGTAIFHENDLSGTRQLPLDIGMGFPVVIRKHFRQTVNHRAFTGNKPLIFGTVRIARSNNEDIACRQVVEDIIH